MKQISKYNLLFGLAFIVFIFSCDKNQQSILSPSDAKKDSTITTADTAGTVVDTTATVTDTTNIVAPIDTLQDNPSVSLGPNQNMSLYNISDFSAVGPVFDDDQIDNLILSGKIGQSPEEALTQLVLTEDGRLVDSHYYNEIILKPNPPNFINKYTNISTFKSVTKFPSADPAYAKLLRISNDKGAWIYDAYQIKFEKTVDANSKKKKNLRIAGGSDCAKFEDVYYARPGDVYITPSKLTDLSSNSYPGHCAGSIYTTYLTKDWNYFLANAGTVEAQGYASSGYDTQTQVDYIRLKNNWSDDKDNMFIIRPTGTTSQRYELAFSWVAQASGDCVYSILARKSERAIILGNGSYPVYTKTYCSLLVWRGFRDYMGWNIDSDGGTHCLPGDILNDACNEDRWFSIEKFAK